MKELLKDIKEIKNNLDCDSITRYKAMILGIICYEKDIEPTEKNIEILNDIYFRWFESDYNLLNNCFNNNEYNLFSYEEERVLNGEDLESEEV